jgi:hypothetical protein
MEAIVRRGILNGNAQHSCRVEVRSELQVQVECRALRCAYRGLVGRSWLASCGSAADHEPADPGPMLITQGGRQLGGGRANSRRSARLPHRQGDRMMPRLSGCSASGRVHALKPTDARICWCRIEGVAFA